MPVNAPSTIAATSVSQSSARMLNWNRGMAPPGSQGSRFILAIYSGARQSQNVFALK